MEQSTEITLGGFQVVAMDDRRYPLAKGKANSFRCPVGAAYGEGWLLLFRADLAELEKGGPFPLEFSAGGEVEIAQVWIHSAHRVNYGNAPDDDSAVYLVRVVDCRFFPHEWSSVARVWNMRNLSGGDPNRKYYRETVPAPDVPYFWSQVLGELWGYCSLPAAFPGIQGNGGAADDDLVIQGGNAWKFLNSCVSKLGRVVAFDPIKNAFRIPRLTRDASPLDKEVDALGLVFDARPFSNLTCATPEYLRIVFQKKWEDYGSERDSDAEQNWLADALYHIDVATGNPQARAGTALSLFATVPAMIKHKTKDALANGADLIRVANRMAEAWLYENSGDRLSRAHLVINGAWATWLPGESVREVIWRNYGDGLVTEIIKYPGLPTDAADAAGCGEFDTFSENDLGRKTWPNYPRLPNVIQVDDPKQADGATIAANKEKLHPGYVWRVVEGRPQKQEKCWIQFCDQWDVKLGDVDGTNKEFYGGRLNGRAESNGERLPLYVAKRGNDGESIIRFRLKSDLATGGSAEAVRLARVAGGYAERERIKVFDWYTTPRGMWQAKAIPGEKLVTEGFALKREAASKNAVAGVAEYDIIWMETYAWTIEFELRTRLGLSAGGQLTAKALVLSAYEQGKDPSDANGDVIVWDDRKIFPYAMAGCRGFATRSEHEPLQPYYKILQCQQMGFFAEADAYEDFCPPMPNFKIEKKTFLITQFSPFNAYPDPIPEEILNPWGHAGKKGYRVRLYFNAAVERWEVVGVFKAAATFVLSNFVDGMCFKDNNLSIAMETCEVPGRRTWHCGTDCSGVDLGAGGDGSGG